MAGQFRFLLTSVVTKQLRHYMCTTHRFSSQTVLFNGILLKKMLAQRKILPVIFKSQKIKTLRSWDIFTSLLLFFGVIEDLEKMDPIILNIKKGILAKQRKQYQKADLILHTALKMAQDVGNTDAETYIFDVMADNFLEMNDFLKAKNLYLDVITRISVKENFTYDCEEMVEISTKLAYCMSKLGEYDPAEKGFQFSIDTQLLRTDKFWNDKQSQVIDDTNPLSDEQKNSLALLGMCYDYYGIYLAERHSQLTKNALAYRLKALKISRTVNGDDHEQTSVLENDVADLYLRLGEYNKATSHLNRAIHGAKATGSSDLPLYYLNMASVLSHQDRSDLAKSFCKKSHDILEKFKEEVASRDWRMIQDKTEHCLNDQKFY